MSFMIDNLLKSDTTLSKNGTHRNAKIDHLFHTTFYRQQNEVFAPIFSKSSVVVNDNKGKNTLVLLKLQIILEKKNSISVVSGLSGIVCFLYFQNTDTSRSNC